MTDLRVLGDAGVTAKNLNTRSYAPNIHITQIALVARDLRVGFLAESAREPCGGGLPVWRHIMAVIEKSKSETPPYIRWYNRHWPLLAKLPPELAKLLSMMVDLDAERQESIAREFDQLIPTMYLGTAMLKAVRS